MVPWLRLHSFTAKDTDSVASQGTKIPQVAWHALPPKKNRVTDSWGDPLSI